MVIDTKWKNIYDNVENVGMDDLRQMFAYHHYFDAAKCYLLFPGEADLQEGSFTNVSYFKKSDLWTSAMKEIITQHKNLIQSLCCAL